MNVNAAFIIAKAAGKVKAIPHNAAQRPANAFALSAEPSIFLPERAKIPSSRRRFPFQIRPEPRKRAAPILFRNHRLTAESMLWRRDHAANCLRCQFHPVYHCQGADALRHRAGVQYDRAGHSRCEPRPRRAAVLCGRRNLHPAARDHAHPADRLRRRHGVYCSPRRQLLPYRAAVRYPAGRSACGEPGRGPGAAARGSGDLRADARGGNVPLGLHRTYRHARADVRRSAGAV